MADTLTGSATLDNLFAGDFPVVTGAVTVLDGEVLVRGSVVGLVTASGKAVLLDKDATDGSQNPYGVVLTAASPSGADGTTSVALSGEFTSSELGFVSGTVYTDVSSAMRALSMYIHVPVASVTGEIS